MPLYIADLKRYFDKAQEIGATHVIIVCDTFDYGDFPVYVMPNEDVKKIQQEETDKPMQRVMEVYSLKLPMMDQYNEPRSFHYE